jgi:hypothetical protein
VKLQRTPKIPSAKELRAEPVGTAYVYRRFLIFGSEATWFVVVKVGADRWMRAQSATSLDDAVAALHGFRAAHTLVVDDLDSNGMAKRMNRKEVEADGTAEHVCLHRGTLAHLPEREERVRPDQAAIAAARRAAATKAGAKALATELARHRPERGATKKQLDALARVIGKLPPDLAQLLRWSNGHRGLELMSIERMIDLHEFLETPGFLALNENENGDYWGLLLTGPLRGALAYHDSDLADPDADAIVATSILAWISDPER